MSELIVAKFGGSSVRDAKAMLRSARVASNNKAKVVVVSATYGTTNDLVELSNRKLTWSQAQQVLSQIEKKHQSIAKDLDCTESDFQQLNEQLKSLNEKVELLYQNPEYLNYRAIQDSIFAEGELLSSILMSRAMANVDDQREAIFFDVRTIMKTDDFFGKASVFIDMLAKKAQQQFAGIREKNCVYITQGFIGQTLTGVTTTLGRGGSDLSATLLGEALCADLVQIWTDVAGVATTDPRLCEKAKPIAEMTYTEASEMAVFGAKVLHPTTLLPAMRKNIPVFVGSSLDEKSGGTWIRDVVSSAPLVRGIAVKNSQSLITLTTPEMVNSHSFLFNVFQIFHEEAVSVDLISTSQISVSFTFDDRGSITDKLLERLNEVATVTVEENFSLISLVGNGMNYTPNISKKVFNALEGINIRLICLGASQYNFCFLIEGQNCPDAIGRLHKTFMESY